MPTGLSHLVFHGGPRDGESFDFPSMQCRDQLSFRSEAYFAFAGDGTIQIRKSVSSQLPSNWLSYCLYIYVKRGHVGGNLVYDFHIIDTVNRCEAITAKGHWCKNRSLPDTNVCGTHVGFPSFLDSDERP